MLVSVRKGHPLLGAFPLVVMAIAVLLVVFAFAMAAASHATDSGVTQAPALGALHAVGGQSR
jgi:hypothetical protein